MSVVFETVDHIYQSCVVDLDPNRTAFTADDCPEWIRIFPQLELYKAPSKPRPKADPALRGQNTGKPKPINGFKHGEFYRFDAISEAELSLGFSFSANVYAYLNDRGWYRFKNGAVIWKVGTSTPAFLTEFAKDKSPKEGKR